LVEGNRDAGRLSLNGVVYFFHSQKHCAEYLNVFHRGQYFFCTDVPRQEQKYTGRKCKFFILIGAMDVVLNVFCHIGETLRV
jgi:hypothetical protein